MLKRLLTVVFVLGLILAFSGTAFTAPNDMPGAPEGGRTPATKVAISGPEYRPLGYSSVNKVAIEGETHPLTQRPVLPSGAGVDTTECHILGWADWVNASFYVTFTRRSNITSYNELAMRYDGPQLPNTAIKLYGAYNWIRRAQDGDLVTGDGHVGVYVRVYDDAASLPGTLIYEEFYSVPNIAATFDYAYFPFATPVILNGNYHISFSVDPAGPSTDTVVWTSDDAGYLSAGGTATITGRASVRTISDGIFKSIFTATGGAININFDQLADFCQVYTKCDYHASPLGSVGLYTVPGPARPSGARRDGGAQRFTTVAPETLKTVIVYHYNYNVYYGGAFYTPTSTNSLNVMVFDDLAGNPDYASGPLATVNIPAGEASLFPITGLGVDGWNWLEVDFSSFNLVLRGPYHLAVQMTSVDPLDGRLLICWGDDTDVDGNGGSVNYSSPGAPWENTGTNADWQAAVGGPEVGFLIEGVTCLDEFALCSSPTSHQGYGTTGFLYMDNCLDPLHYGSRNGIAGRIVGQTINRVEKVRFQILDEFSGDGYPNVNSQLKVSICAVTGNNVGAVLWTTTLDESLGQLTMYPGWTEVVIPGGVTAINEFFVTLEPIFTLDGDTEWMYFGRERQSSIPAVTLKNGGMHVKLCADNLWYNNNTLLPGVVDNATIEADICSVPPTRWTCTAPQDFQTAGADYARTSHAQVAFSDAYCDLTFKWKYVDPIFNAASNRISNSGPVVYDTFVVCGFSSRYRFLNLNDGTVVGEFYGAGAPYYLPTTGVNCTPTIAMVDVGGTPTPVMYVGSGNSSGYRVFAAYDLSNFVPAGANASGFVPAQLWTVNASNYGAMGYTFPATPMPQHIGATNWTNPIVLNLGGTDMVFFNTNDQYVWAANAATGVRIWGPIVINGLTYKGMATDGTNLYISNTALLPTYPLGDITCWDAATGAAKWALSTAAGGGLKGATTMPDYGNETFVSGLAVYGGEVYTVSTTPEVDDPSGQYGGLFYRINASTGAVLTVTPTEHRRQDGGLALNGGVMVDATTIVVPSSTRWANSVNGGQLFGYNRFTGGQNWVTSEGAYNADAGHIYDGILTCEAGDTDLGFVTNINGYLSCFDPVTGDEYFSRRFNHAAAVGGAIGVSKNGDMLVADRNGAIFCLTKQTDRPRLEILEHAPQGNTYGPLPSVIVTIPNVYYNSGCDVLTGTVTFSTTSNGSTLGPVASSTGVRTNEIADLLTQSSSKGMLMTQPNYFSESREVAEVRPSLNRAALATPPFFNVATLPINLLPGDTGSFVIDVHQALVYRGENVFYAYFSTNDPDYFLDSLILEPQVRGLIVGGCLLDTTTLHFGTGGANVQWVLNVPRMGHWGENDDTWYMDISGDHDDFYGGYYVYGVSRERIAMNTQDWWVGNGEARAYKALQGDPNLCSVDCKPALLSAQTFGMITENGATYVPLTGNLVCRTYLDSVQMWAPLDSLGNYGVWNWNTTWLTAGTYNSDSTMGLLTHSRSIGFENPPAAYPYLGKVVVDFMKTFLRYPGAPAVSNWRIGEWIDYDIGQDTVLHYPTFAAYSTCASVPALPGTRTTGTWGTIKLPYGGGCNSEVYPTLRNAVSMEGNQSMNNTTIRGNAYLDSVYLIMGRPAGTYSQGPMRTAPGDQRSHDTWLHHDFPNSDDTLRFAIAHFGDPALASPSNVNSMVAPLATILNKWVGMDRGDVNNDGALNLADIVYLADYAAYGSATAAHPGPIPFAHVGDVNVDSAINGADVTYLVNYYFFYGDCPMSKYIEY